jgi:flagellar motor switch protein FliN/FliY
VVELDRQANELLDILVNGTLIAKGEVVTVNGRYGIRVVEVSRTEERFAGLERRA